MCDIKLGFKIYFGEQCNEFKNNHLKEKFVPKSKTYSNKQSPDRLKCGKSFILYCVSFVWKVSLGDEGHNDSKKVVSEKRIANFNLSCTV